MKHAEKIILLAILIVIFAACSERDLKMSSSEQVSHSESQNQSQQLSSQESNEDSSEPEVVNSQKYADILKSGNYYIDCIAVIDMQGMKLENSMLIAVKDGNSSISVSSDLTGSLVTIRTLIYDGNVYTINDTQRSYIQIEPSEIKDSFNTDYSKLSYIGESEGEFCDETLSCSEYSEGEDIVRFFFKENKLVGITRSISDDQVSEMALIINGVSSNIPDHLIEVPIGYTKQ